MIYFDNAATTPPITTPQEFFNPSSPHGLGIKAERALRNARAKLNLSLSPDGDIFFTSGGTESNNLAILGLALARPGLRVAAFPFEHPSILAPIQFAVERLGASNVAMDKLPPAGNLLVSFSQVSHETGDIYNLAAQVKEQNPSAIVHVDGVQGFCKDAFCFKHVDMYSFSGHKCHGPVGVGGLWVRKGLHIVPLMHGGGQENALRSGTENVAGIVQMAEAAATLDIEANRAHVSKVKAEMLKLAEDLPDVCINAATDNVSPYILNMSFLGVKGEVMVHALSARGLAVSMGAACRSRKRGKPALELMGFATKIAESAVRFSFSHLNTIDEAIRARELVAEEVRRFRKVFS